MTVYSREEAEKKFSDMLNAAWTQGEVQIRSENGQFFTLRPLAPDASPLDVPGIKLNLTDAEIIAAVREGRER